MSQPLASWAERRGSAHKAFSLARKAGSFARKPPEALRARLCDPRASASELVRFVFRFETCLYLERESDFKQLMVPPTREGANYSRITEVAQALVSLFCRKHPGATEWLSFWRYALRCFALKEFEHSIKLLARVHLDVLKSMTEQIEASLRAEGTSAGRIVNFAVKQESPSGATAEVVRLFYAYLALLAALPHRRPAATKKH